MQPIGRPQSTEHLKKMVKDYADKYKLAAPCVCDGSYLSEIAIVSEAPGGTEIETGRPFTGASGAKLTNALQKIGVSRMNVYMTNVVKRQVSMSQTDKRFPITKHELEHWHNILMWELGQLPNLKYVLVLGNYALKAILGKSGIMNWRGSVLVTSIAGKEVTTLSTYNPAMIIREPKHGMIFNFDIGKFKKVINGTWVERPVTKLINPSYDDAMDYMDMIGKAGKDVAYDIETSGNETACVGVGNSPTEAMCINFRTLTDNHYTAKQDVQIYKRLAWLLSGDTVPLVAQNGMFDASWLWFKDRIRVHRHDFDTMLAHHTLYPSLPHNLGFITTQYTSRPYYKDEKDTWREHGDIDSFWGYNAQDVCNTLEASIHIKSELRNAKLDEFFYSHVMRAFPHLLRMCVGGIRVDMELKHGLKTLLEKRVMDLTREFNEQVQQILDDPEYICNPGSPPQLSNLLFSKFKLVGRGTSTNKENRDRMFKHPATTEPKRKVLQQIDLIAAERKFLGTYVNSAVDDDGRMRCTYNQTGTQSAPGRLSSSGMLWKNSEGDQTGTNLQNQPERAQDMFIADDGYCFVYFDLSQAEARVVGWLANIEHWIEDFERARLDGTFDCHRSLASTMFKIPYDDVPTFDRDDNGAVTKRFVAKRCRHGLNYRMAADRLATTTGLPLPEAINAYNLYHRVNPELRTWWSQLEHEIRTTKTLYNVYGRRLILLEPPRPEALESMVAFKPQSTIGDKVVRCIYLCESDPQWPVNARMVLNIHDALIALVPKHYAKRVGAIMKKHAEEPMYINGRELIIPADLKISYPNEKGYHSWKTLKKLEL
jgi:uracil-DNA glycosylase family 4